MVDEIAIVGGGIAGLALGAALTRRQHPFRIWEARADAGAGGAALAMAPNAMWALRRLGVADAVIPFASRIDQYRFVNRDGAPLKTLDLTALSGPWGEFSWAVPRHRILAALVSAMAPSTVATQAEVVHLFWRNDRWILDVQGSANQEAAWIIGADGARSRVRQTVWPGLPEPRYQGFYALRGIAPIQLPKEWSHSVFQVWGAPGEFGFSPVGTGSAYWFGTMAWPHFKIPPTPDDFLAHFHGWFSPIRDLITSTEASELLIHPIYDRLEPYPDGPKTCALIGDAAHLMTPNTGQGACQGIMDAWVLGELLAQRCPREALAEYRSLRLGNALAVAQRSRRLGQVIHSRAIPEGVKQFLLKTAPDRWMLNSMRQVIGAPPNLPESESEG